MKFVQPAIEEIKMVSGIQLDILEHKDDKEKVINVQFALNPPHG